MLLVEDLIKGMKLTVILVKGTMTAHFAVNYVSEARDAKMFIEMVF